MGRIQLIENWGESYIYGDKSKGIYVGRKDELESLVYTLKNHDSGSILISALRGAGKTSFVQKALSVLEEELNSENKELFPVFVNAGHALARARQDDKEHENHLAKKELLISLIRGAYYQNKSDKEMSKLYQRAISSYEKEIVASTAIESSSSSDIALTGRLPARDLFVLMCYLLAFSGFTQVYGEYSNLIGLVGLIILPLSLSFSWSKKTSKKNHQGENEVQIMENTIDYLELEFEKWIRSKKEKKIIFVIDELDKVSDDIALTLIKEYKNLFSRSFAHYIFIAAEEAYPITKKSRKSKQGSELNKFATFPTLFTHTYFLPLPSASELRSYLDSIFELKHDEEEDGSLEMLKNYLLFSSKNDYFALKNLINDLQIIENSHAFLDIDLISQITPRIYERSSHIYEYASQFCQKYSKKGKKHWKENSEFQEKVFDFLETNLSSSFKEDYNTRTTPINSLIKFLLRLETLEEAEQAEGVTDTTYRWTGQFKAINKADQLFEEEREFLEKFKLLIKVANDLDDLVDGNFDEHKNVVEGRDGKNISGIALHEISESYQDLNALVKIPESRMGVLLEDVRDAVKDIDQSLDEISLRGYHIVSNGLAEISSKNGGDLIVNTQLNDNETAFSFLSSEGRNSLLAADHAMFCRKDGNGEVLILRNYKDIKSIETDLANLKRNKQSIVINMCEEVPEGVFHPKVFRKSNGNMHRKGQVVDNFYNIPNSRDIRSYIPYILKATSVLDLDYSVNTPSYPSTSAPTSSA